MWFPSFPQEWPCSYCPWTFVPVSLWRTEFAKWTVRGYQTIYTWWYLLDAYGKHRYRTLPGGSSTHGMGCHQVWWRHPSWNILLQMPLTTQKMICHDALRVVRSCQMTSAMKLCNKWVLSLLSVRYLSRIIVHPRRLHVTMSCFAACVCARTGAC